MAYIAVPQLASWAESCHSRQLLALISQRKTFTTICPAHGGIKFPRAHETLDVAEPDVAPLVNVLKRKPCGTASAAGGKHNESPDTRRLAQLSEANGGQIIHLRGELRIEIAD